MKHFTCQQRELLAPNGQYLREGDTIYRSLYAQTLRNIGKNGASYFYEGDFMEQMVRELKDAGAIIEEIDLLNYTAIERAPVESYFNGLKVLGPPPPSSGAVLALILNILQGSHYRMIRTECIKHFSAQKKLKQQKIYIYK